MVLGRAAMSERLRRIELIFNVNWTIFLNVKDRPANNLSVNFHDNRTTFLKLYFKFIFRLQDINIKKS
uniref:Uncharacterized protein n=1 Tax=Strongyloides papillosus TaxID=174720 RepID=A0A0N5BEQ2_STREA